VTSTSSLITSNLQLIISLISIVLVSSLGLISNILIIRINQKQSISSKIIEQYLKIREEISDVISDLAALRTIGCFELESINNVSMNISKLYYKHYDFLPIEVLDDILCLHSTLIDKDNRIYRIKNKNIYIIEEIELEGYIESTSSIPNSKYFTYSLLKSNDDSVRRATCINLQARKALNTMNEFFTLANLISWVKHMPKQ
jgi:hypothetical protein